MCESNGARHHPTKDLERVTIADGRTGTKETSMKRLMIFVVSTLVWLYGCEPCLPTTPQEANGQILIRQQGQIVAAGSFVFYQNRENKTFLLSAGHVIQPETGTTYIVIWHEQAATATPVYVDTNVDFSVLAVNIPMAAPCVVSQKPGTNESSITTIGSHHKRWCTVVINGLYDSVDPDTGYIVYDMPGVCPGYSGAGVFNTSGELAGIIVVSVEATGYVGVVPMSSIISSLKLSGHTEYLPNDKDN